MCESADLPGAEGQINVLKGVNSLATLLCIIMLLRYYWLRTIFDRLSLVPALHLSWLRGGCN